MYLIVQQPVLQEHLILAVSGIRFDLVIISSKPSQLFAGLSILMLKLRAVLGVQRTANHN